MIKTAIPAHTVRHDTTLASIARVEGQVRAIRRMVEEGEYCIDILTQIQAAQAALGAVGRKVLRRHMDHCVTNALKSGSKAVADEKIEELMKIVSRKFS